MGEDRRKQGLGLRGVAIVGAAIGAVAIGAFAVGAFAIGALAIRRLAIESVVVGKGTFKSLEIDELRVKELRGERFSQSAASLSQTSNLQAAKRLVFASRKSEALTFHKGETQNPVNIVLAENRHYSLRKHASIRKERHHGCLTSSCLGHG